MTEGEVCPDETKSTPIAPLQAVRPPNSALYVQESGSWFPDPMRVEKSFVRNLGGLMPPAAATSGPGPVGEARKSEARPEGMRSRTTA